MTLVLLVPGLLMGGGDGGTPVGASALPLKTQQGAGQ